MGRSPLVSSFPHLQLPAVVGRGVEECELEGEHLFVAATLRNGDHSIQTPAKIDTGTTGFAFIDKNFVRQHKFRHYTLNPARDLELIDGRSIESGKITHLTEISWQVQDHTEMLPTFITKLGHFSLVLGIPWLQKHAVVTDFVRNSVQFQCPDHQNPPVAPRVALETIGVVPKTTNMATETPKGTTMPHPGVALKPPDVTSNLKSKSPVIYVISSASLKKLIQRKESVQIFAMSLYDINKALETATPNPQDTEPAEPPDYERLKSLIPPEYHSFLPLFCESFANKLPPHRPYDHRIPLKVGFEPHFEPLYSLARHELEACKKWIEENLDKGFIRASSSPAGALILFVKKGDRSLRLVVDYRGINEGTVKNRYPLLLIRETLMQRLKARFFTKLDVRGAYNLIRMAEGEEWKTTF